MLSRADAVETIRIAAAGVQVIMPGRSVFLAFGRLLAACGFFSGELQAIGGGCRMLGCGLAPVGAGR